MRLCREEKIAKDRNNEGRLWNTMNFTQSVYKSLGRTFIPILDFILGLGYNGINWTVYLLSKSEFAGMPRGNVAFKANQDNKCISRVVRR